MRLINTELENPNMIKEWVDEDGNFHSDDFVPGSGSSGDSLWEKGEGENSVQTIINDPSWGKNEAKGGGSVAEGVSTKADTFASHTEGYQTATVKDNVLNAQYAHAEGYRTTAGGVASHVEGDNTVANNRAEHAEGRYNKSNMGGTDATNTLHSIGIGDASMETPGGDRKNAFEVMQNGDAYLIGVGEYDGKNIDTAETLQETINNKQDTLTAGDNITIVGNVISATGGDRNVVKVTYGDSTAHDKITEAIAAGKAVVVSGSFMVETVVYQFSNMPLIYNGVVSGNVYCFAGFVVSSSGTCKAFKITCYKSGTTGMWLNSAIS